MRIFHKYMWTWKMFGNHHLVVHRHSCTIFIGIIYTDDPPPLYNSCSGTFLLFSICWPSPAFQWSSFIVQTGFPIEKEVTWGVPMEVRRPVAAKRPAVAYCMICRCILFNFFFLGWTKWPHSLRPTFNLLFSESPRVIWDGEQIEKRKMSFLLNTMNKLLILCCEKSCIVESFCWDEDIGCKQIKLNLPHVT